MIYAIKCIPMGAVRMTRAGKFTSDSAKRYLKYKKSVALQLLSQHKKDPFDAALEVEVIFRLPIPESIRNHTNPFQLHTKKPDIDNLIKGLFDAANGIIWVDDNRVSSMIVKKVYSNNPGIHLEVKPIGGLAYGQAKATPKKAKQAAKRTGKGGESGSI